eukprot:364501-Chlamydomonas_euryale.AAC.3
MKRAEGAFILSHTIASCGRRKCDGEKEKGRKRLLCEVVQLHECGLGVGSGLCMQKWGQSVHAELGVVCARACVCAL